MILVDSDVLISHLRGVPAARGWMAETRRREGRLAVSVVSVAEITGGMRSAQRREVWALLATMHVEDVNEVIARRAGEMRRQFRRSHSSIATTDYLIAATAEVRGLQVATLNVRDHPMFRGLRPPFRLTPPA